MKIVFSCLGFSTTEVFVIKDDRCHCIGGVSTRTTLPEFYLNNGLWSNYMKKEELPSSDDILSEYDRQWKMRNGKSWINNEIVYAG